MRTVGIIEDQTAIREMIIHAVLDEDAFEVIFSTGNGQEGYEKCIELKPDFVILDVMLPKLNGTEILRLFADKLPESRFLVFSAYQSPELIRELLQAGAHGFVEKSASLAELRKGVDIVSSGGSYFSREVSLLLRDAIADPKKGDSATSILTKREREILQLIATSNSTREIAEKLEIRVKTVDNHRTNLMRKLDLHDVASLTRYAISRGIVSMGD
jgi:DNA-binding NarL/FixJ family response regulator